MREIESKAVTQAVRQLCIDANCHLGEDVKECIRCSRREETWPVAQGILDNLVKNYEIAAEHEIAICQDTGMACVFVELGQDVHIEGNFEEAIHQGVRQGYGEGYLRKSIVGDPLRRVNTEDNTPAAITVRLVPGDQCTITVAPKGFGSENMTALRMLKPSVGPEAVVDFIVEAVSNAGSNPCPPIVVGVGVGGTSEMATLLAKRALLRPVDQHNEDPFYADLEAKALARINALGIGPQGLGGTTTALSVCILHYGTHIAGLPCAVNIGCHVTRHASAVL